MKRSLLTIVAGAAVYGAAVGLVHGPLLAARNLVKFPALILSTALICGPAYFVCTLVVTSRLTLRDVTELSLRTFADAALLLASMAPVCALLATTLVQPTEASLHEYPMFLGINVLFIACAGTIALSRQALRLARERGLGLGRSSAVIAAWLAVSLFAGGQCAWYMRPFFCPAIFADPAFMEGTRPDYRGATSFYEAVAHLVDPPALPRAWFRSGRER